MKIELYLQGLPVEIDNDIDFVLNKQFTDLTDLTSIIVDYSKTIKVPMTPHNNELFNFIYKLDHQVIFNEDVVYFDPSQKISMTMTFNQSKVMDGYALLNSVNLKDRTYEINLYGQLGSIFSDMKEKPLNKYLEVNNGMFKKNLKMHTTTIHDSFWNDDHSLDWTSTDWTDFFGFAPQLIGKTDTINTKTFEKYGTGEIKKFVDVINTTRGITYADSYVGDGFDFNQYCEIKSYMTRPYVYVDKLIQLVQNEINQGDYDGYTMTLDQDWFNEDNPYYKNMVFFPGNESIVDSGENTSGMVNWNYNEIWMNFPMTYLPSTSSVDLDGYTYSTGTNNLVTIANSTPGEETNVTLTLNCDGIVVRDRITGVGSTSGFNTNGKWAFYNLSSIDKIPIRYIGIYDSNDNLIYKLYLCDNTIHSVYKHTAFLENIYKHATFKDVWTTLKKLNNKVLVPNSCAWTNGSSSNSYCEVTQVYNFGNIVLNTNSFRFKVGCDVIEMTHGWMDTTNISRSSYSPLCPFKNDKYRDAVWNDGATWNSYFRPIQSLSVTSSTYRSGSIWTIYDILGNDFNPFTWLIDYVKKFRLFFDIDYDTKVIDLKSTYFNDIEYRNVTVDYSKPVVVEPIVDKYAKYNFGYKKNDSKKEAKYYKNTGVVYGDMDVDTSLNINNENLSLIPNEDESVFIPVDLKCLYWSNLNSNNQIKMGNPLKKSNIINTLNKDGEIEYYPFYAFRWGNYIQHSRFYYISDDTPNQRNTGECTYLEHKGLGEGWEAEVEGQDEEGFDYYYLLCMAVLPRFDNYITKEVSLRSTSIIPGRSLSLGVEEEDTITGEEGSGSPDEVTEAEYTDPATGRTRVVKRSIGNYTAPLEDDEETQVFIYWVSFGVPAEVYNGYLPNNIENFCIYNRWSDYLNNEIFNVHNKKVTCYVRMSYPEFINFKFNQLFVIDNCTFLVNKIIDFNPNSTEPTKVELIQISDVDNLR